MYKIIVAIKNTQTVFQVAFKEESTALAALENYKKQKKDAARSVTIKGDYGHIVLAELSEISGMLLMNVEGENAANVEAEVLTEHAKKNLQDKLRADPVLGLVTMQGQARLAS